MFKRLRERIAEEATTRLAGNQIPFGNNTALPSDSHTDEKREYTEDLIVLGDSSSVIEPLPSTQQFSIAEDEDPSFSDQSSPLRKANSSAGSELSFSAGNKNTSDVANSNIFGTPQSPYIPLTDIESEVEEPPTLNLDGISKEQLLLTIELAKAKLCKYRNKYAEAVKAYKHASEEKKKLEHTLTENQDKSFRRIAELREQCHLEQKAKAHLEENLRLILEEKESRISVLETQITLLKERQVEESPETVDAPKKLPEQNSLSIDSTTQQKIEKLQYLLNECKVTILAKTEKINELTKEKEVLCQKIVTQSKTSEEFEEKKTKLLAEHEEIVENLTKRLTELEKQQEDSAMAMAETKQNMHEELKIQEQQLMKLKEEAKLLQSAVDHEKVVNTELKKLHEEKVKELNRQLENTEKIMEEGKKNLMQELSQEKAEAVALMQEENTRKIAAVEEEWAKRLRDLETKNEELLRARVTTKEVELGDIEKNEQVKAVEDKYQSEITDLKQQISQFEQLHVTIEKECQLRIKTMEGEMKVKFDEQATKFGVKLGEKDVEIKHLKNAAEKCKAEYTENFSKLHDDMKNKQSIISQLKNQLSSLETTDRSKMDEFARKIKQLEHEREQLMMQAQERVAATEMKCREDLTQLEAKMQDLMLQNKEIVKLKSENSKLNSQLDESLLVAASNQAEATKELTKLKENIQVLQEQVSEKDKDCTDKTEKLEDLQKGFNSLKSKNESLKSELDSVALLKQEKHELNEKVRVLEHSKKDLTETVELLRNEHESLRTSSEQEVLTFKMENESLTKKLKEYESHEFKCHKCDRSGTSDYDVDHKECDEKLQAKELELESKLKLVIKEFCTQMDVKDFDYDKSISDLLEKSQIVEEKLEREHKLEIAALHQDIFEKDCALEEMRDHYEGIIKENDAVIKEYEKSPKPFHASAKTNSELPTSEPSDWDDAWVLPEESSENISPTHSCKVDHDKHKQEVQALQEELEKSNSELKDLRLLLRLSPPQSLHSNANYGAMVPISEPTEFEYLKNILFEYMMGKETVTLVKVIAAVLRFSDEETHMVVQREKSKQQMK